MRVSGLIFSVPRKETLSHKGTEWLPYISPSLEHIALEIHSIFTKVRGWVSRDVEGSFASL